MSNRLAVEIRGLSKSYHDPRSGTITVLSNISFNVRHGHILGLFGPSGCGKTTLLRIIAGVLSYDSGEALLEGRPAKQQRGAVAYVPQTGNLLEWKTLWGNALLGWSIMDQNAKANRQSIIERATKYFSDFGLTKQKEQYPQQCSGGERQKAALIRALLSPARLLALDEPAGAIDQLTRVSIYETLLAEMQVNTDHNKHMSAIIVSHDPEELLLLCDEIISISSRGASPLKAVTVPFPRPRQADLRYSSTFSEYKRRLAGHLP